MVQSIKIVEYHLTDHARFEMKRRGITENQISQVLASPGQAELVQPGRVVCQSKVRLEGFSKEHLIRVFVDVNHRPPAVVTAYRTTKICKYWRK